MVENVVIDTIKNKITELNEDMKYYDDSIKTSNVTSKTCQENIIECMKEKKELKSALKKLEE